MSKGYLITLFIIIYCGNIDKKVFVPDEKTAIKIAEAVWFSLYGDIIYSKKPFHATLVGDSVWYVSGTLQESTITFNQDGDTIYTIHLGGVPYAKISKFDGKIYDVYHSK